MSGTVRFGLPRTLRIERSSDFRRLRETGRREVSGCLVMNWRAADRLRVGVVTSRKVGPSVDRSRARRLIREAFRLHQHEFALPVEIVLVARPSISKVTFADVERDFVRLLNRAKIWLNPNPV
jgi:ribonuclease P protein component